MIRSSWLQKKVLEGICPASQGRCRSNSALYKSAEVTEHDQTEAQLHYTIFTEGGETPADNELQSS